MNKVPKFGTKGGMEMFKMIFKLDTERMERDGINAEEKMQELRTMIESAGLTETEPGVLETDSSGKRNLLFDLLKASEWFMKYVCEWRIDDPAVKDDVIEAYNEMGIRCCYED